MAPEKVTEMILNVDLKCSGCYKKVKKVICKIPQIRDQVFHVDKNEVKIRVVCCDPEKIRDKLCYKGGGSIQSIEIIEKPKEPDEKPKVAAAGKPKEPEKAKPTGDKPKEPAKGKSAADKPKEPEKAKPAADKPKEPEKAKPTADKPKEPEKAKPTADKPKEPEKAKPTADKPKEPEKAKPAADKPKDSEKPKEPEKPKPADKPKESGKAADKPKDSGKPPEPEKAKPKEGDKPSPPKEAPAKADAGPNPDVAKMVYEPVHGYPQLYPQIYPLPAYPMVGYGQHYDHYYGGAPFQYEYGTPVPSLPPPSYSGFDYGNEYNGNMIQHASNDYVGDEDEEGCSIM